MSWRLSLAHPPEPTKLGKSAASKLKKIPLPPPQTLKPHPETVEQNTCRSSQSTEEQLLSQPPETHLLHITCYQQKYTIDLLSKQSLEKFCYQIDRNQLVSKLTKISIKMVAIKKACEVNEKIDDQWNIVNQQYETFHGSIFNC